MTDNYPEERKRVRPSIEGGDGMATMGQPRVDGIGEDVRLTIDTPAGPVLAGSLIRLALLARYAPHGELLPFVYRDPIDLEDPDAPRPLRRAVLTIVGDEILPTAPVEPPSFLAYCACSDLDCPTPEGRFTHGPETPREEAENDRDSR